MRKLAYCAGGFSAAIFLAHFLLPARWVLPGALAAVVLALVTLLLLGQTRRRVMAALLSAAIGFGWYAAASALRLTPVQNVSGDVQTVTARVTEYPVAYARSYGLTALLTSPDVPNCKARLYVSDADAAALRPGDEITADVKFRPSTLRYGEETDAYISKGIYLIGSVRDKTLARTGVWSRSWLYWPKTVAQSLKTSAQAAFPADVLPFAQALMLGDKSALDARLLPADVKLSRPRRKIRAFFSATTASSVGAMVFTVPLTALHFGNISLIAPVTNLLILWLLPAAFIGCYLAALLGLVWAWGGTALAWVTAWPLRYILAVANVLSKLPGAVLFTGSRMVVWWLVLVYAMFGAAWLLSRRRKVRYWIPAACSVLALCAVLTVNAVQLQRTSTVTALDVSQGQSIVFSSGRSCAVVDCGGRSTAEDPGDLAARKLLAQGHRSLDLLVLTHPHDDHVNGVLRLMHWLPVRTLVIPAAADITQAPLSDILALAEVNHTTVVRVDAQQTIAAGGISVRLYPEPCAGQEDGSMIVLASIGDYDTLVPGDVDTTAEAKFLSTCTYPDIELLFVGHHGSKRSTGDAWLDAIAPDAAIISVGYNSYGHPTSDTLERLQAHHIPIYRTDQMGDITVHLS